MEGDKATLAKARIELEELYEGIQDESVNLTFQDFVDVKRSSNSNIITVMEPISEVNSTIPTSQGKSLSPLSKLPSLDFNRALQAANVVNQHHHHHLYHDHRLESVNGDFSVESYRSNISHHHHDDHGESPHSHSHATHDINGGRISDLEVSQLHKHTGPNMSHLVGFRNMGGYDEPSSNIKLPTSINMERVSRRRPGIPHSNICTNCTCYIYVFRHRCLVCGRAYCRQCVSLGMGDMTEGRKCIECLGRRFSHRYIERAGKVGCCGWRYSSMVKQAELKWAEKGPRRRGYIGDRDGDRDRSVYATGRSTISRSSPVVMGQAAAGGLGTPTSCGGATSTTAPPPQFGLSSSSFSSYSPTHRHHLPF